jgi:hypothetical protein
MLAKKSCGITAEGVDYVLSTPMSLSLTSRYTSTDLDHFVSGSRAETLHWGDRGLGRCQQLKEGACISWSTLALPARPVGRQLLGHGQFAVTRGSLSFNGRGVNYG